MRQVGVQRDVGSGAPKLERRGAHEQVVGVVGERRRGVDCGVGREPPRDLLDELLERLSVLAVLLVEEAQVGRLPSGERESAAILLDPLADALAESVAPVYSSHHAGAAKARRHAGEHVYHHHVTRLGQHVPARQNGVIEVRGENHGAH